MARVLFTYTRQSSELSLIQIQKRPNERECFTAKLYSIANERGPSSTSMEYSKLLATPG